MNTRTTVKTPGSPARALAIAYGLLLAIGSITGIFIGDLIGSAIRLREGYWFGFFVGAVLASSIFGALLAVTITRTNQKHIVMKAFLGAATWGIAFGIWFFILVQIGRIID
jgi:outer membrane lipoprotein SlyB